MKVILAVTGCIGAYKAAVILRLLQKEGHEVFPVMTRNAERFITPLTLEKLSGNRVVSSLWDAGTGEVDHISSARQADLLLVAPATANILAKFAHGIADDFLSTLHLAFDGPVMIAPAMNTVMWESPATRENCRILASRGVMFINPGDGYQACGEVGPGRLAEPVTIVKAVRVLAERRQSLAGKKVLVTAGPTVQDLDPVRFFSNRSTGRMGYAVAAEAVERGADVTLVSGPVAITPPPGVNLVMVRSAGEMAEEVFALFPGMDVVVKAAAVSDYSPVSISREKIKKTSGNLVIELTRTIDILKELGSRKTSQFLVGFAAESEDLEENARRKLKEKSLDLVVANDITSDETGFASEYNQVIILDKDNNRIELSRSSKQEIAVRIWDRIEALIQ
ncbi:MAG: bifunctional phosphopantothenoylcysteine decarboxylase/phosphopantothenate--cysteine ligase CoaBC [Acidobacteriota bacterium]